MRSRSESRESLLEVLEGLAEYEQELTERFYASFFARRPDTRELFGVHSLGEQEEMMAETLRSLLAYSANESWLSGNLHALGQSHSEYGVEPDMYDSFAAVFIETAQAILGDTFSERHEVALRDSLAAVCAEMLLGVRSRQSA
jgi:hemoglobin-like flavoprotein